MTDTEPRPATMLDVAHRAGVSHQTVSRYLRFEGGLKPATSERIAAAIAELRYAPNLVARTMRTRRSGRIAVILPGANSFSPTPTLAGAVAAAQDAGFSVEALSVDGGADDRAARIRELVASGAVEGILALAPLPADIGSPAVPVVVSADFDDDMRSIGPRASGSAVAELIEGLAALGHRRFAHITGELSFASARARRDVFEETAGRSGLECARVIEGGWDAAAGAAAIAALAPGEVTAIIAGNDIVAAGAIRAAAARGWAVPGDVSVTGWDDHRVGELLSPSLTTVAIDHARLGREAMAQVVASIRGQTMLPTPAPPAHRVIWRESTGPAPA